MQQQRRKEHAAILSVVSNTTLVVLKVAVGLIVGSVSVISEAIHSGVDLLAAVVALFSVKTSGIPADRRHSFGHGKIENISGTVEAVLIFVAAAWIIFEAAGKILHPQPLDNVGWGVAVMLVSSVVNLAVSRMLFRVGRETDSIALQADAWHLRTDVYTSAGVMVGLFVIWIAHTVLPGRDVQWIDPVAAIGVALLIMRAAYNLTVQSASDLLDVQLPGEELEWIHRQIRERGAVIRGFHQLRTRKAGHFRFVEFHLKMDPKMSVLESHHVTEELSHAIRKRLPSTSVTIHVEPCDGACAGNCLEGCLLPEEERIRIGGERLGNAPEAGTQMGSP